MNPWIAFFMAVSFGILGFALGGRLATNYWKLTQISEPQLAHGFDFKTVDYSYGPYIATAGAPGIRLEIRTR